jgi:hypothetical protein
VKQNHYKKLIKIQSSRNPTKMLWIKQVFTSSLAP